MSCASATSSVTRGPIMWRPTTLPPLSATPEPPLQADTPFLVPGALRDRPPAGGDEGALGGDGPAWAIGRLVGDGGTAAGCLGGRGLPARQGLDPPLSELAGQLGRHLFVLSPRPPGGSLEDGGVDPPGSVEAGGLEPHGPPPHGDCPGPGGSPPPRPVR